MNVHPGVVNTKMLIPHYGRVGVDIEKNKDTFYFNILFVRHSYYECKNKTRFILEKESQIKLFLFVIYVRNL